MLVPGGDEARGGARGGGGACARWKRACAGYTFALGRSRVTEDPCELPRAASEALLAANVAQGSADGAALAFEQTGAYRLLLSAMSENPSELQRFYAETVEPLVAYDEQYETELAAHARDVPGGGRQRSRAPPSGCSPIATPSTIAWSGCASCPGLT